MTEAARPGPQDHKGRAGSIQRFDAVVVGAGFSGLYALHKLRESGLRVRVLEAADKVGGTWRANRYPGARCDIESIEYSYSFSAEIQQEWVWTEVLPGQPEIEAYLDFVADRLDLRRDLQFNTKVTAMTFDEDDRSWRLETAPGETFVASFVIAATGILSSPLDPGLKGQETFRGATLFSSQFPRAGYDFTAKRVAIVGTGSTGVQATPVVAEQAEHLYVFQRSAPYTLPSPARAYEPGELDALKARYDEIRAAQRETHVGAARTSAFSVLTSLGSRPALKTASRAEQRRAVEERGVAGALFWSDILFDIEASQLATSLYAEAVARIVKDPETAASLVPDYPFGCKRPIIDSGFYESFNRGNVTLVDVKKNPIREITPTGIQTEQGFHELDVILYATGFDAITGALSRIDVRGRAGASLGETWATDGPASYLGLQVAGFPNLFTIQGPGSPAAAANFVAALEHQVDWIADCLSHLRAEHYRVIEAQPSAQADWGEHTASLVEGSVLVHPTCNSWWIGANVPGKKRVYLSYAAGLPEFRRRCDEIAAAGYTGFTLS